MDNLFVIFITSLGLGFSGAVVPGPLLALTLKESLGRGKVAALWLSGGHSFCELLMVGAIAGGLNQFISVETISGPIGLLGGVILLWMGIGAFKQTRTTAKPFDNASPLNRPRSLLIGGAAVTLSNPYWTVWWLTVGLMLILSAAKAGFAGVATFYVGHILSDFLWFGCVGFVVGWRRQMLNDGVYLRILQACAVFLVGFGLFFTGYGGIAIHSRFLP